MSSLFLFGAGASYGSGPCSPGPPPLGRDLFKELRTLNGIASTVSDELASLFNEDFEEGMDEFFNNRNVEVTPLLREMAAYFVHFEPLPGNNYGRLLRALGRKRNKTTFVTTNYDLLLERSASSLGLNVTYGPRPVEENTISLLKIHGSCNFLPDMPPRQIQGIGFDVSKGASILDAPVRFATTTSQVLDFCSQEDSIAPAIAMYSPDKRKLYCPSFLKAQQYAWESSIETASRVYVIGLRVHTVDEHIWGPLANSCKPLYYVGGEPREYEKWSYAVNRRNAFVLGTRFEDAFARIAQHLG